MCVHIQGCMEGKAQLVREVDVHAGKRWVFWPEKTRQQKNAIKDGSTTFIYIRIYVYICIYIYIFI